MRQMLWPSAPGEHAAEISAFFRGDRSVAAQVFVAVDHVGRPMGLAEVSIVRTRKVAIRIASRTLEGWFVDESHRGTGVGAALVRAVEAWGRTEGCTELASDTEIGNHASEAAHRALGFEEAGRVVCFRKALSEGDLDAEGRRVHGPARDDSFATPERGSLNLRRVCPLLQVFDMPASLVFYRDVLGFALVETAPAAGEVTGDQFGWVWLRRDDAELMLNTAYDPEAVRPPTPDPSLVAAHGDTALFIGCPDVDAAYEHLRAHGVPVGAPTVAPYGMKQLYVRDSRRLHAVLPVARRDTAHRTCDVRRTCTRDRPRLTLRMGVFW